MTALGSQYLLSKESDKWTIFKFNRFPHPSPLPRHRRRRGLPAKLGRGAVGTSVGGSDQEDRGPSRVLLFRRKHPQGRLPAQARQEEQAGIRLPQAHYLFQKDQIFDQGACCSLFEADP